MLKFSNFFVCEKKQKPFFQSIDCIRFTDYQKAIEYSNKIKSHPSSTGSIIIPTCKYLPSRILYPVLQYKLSKYILRPNIILLAEFTK